MVNPGDFPFELGMYRQSGVGPSGFVLRLFVIPLLIFDYTLCRDAEALPLSILNTPRLLKLNRSYQMKNICKMGPRISWLLRAMALL